MEIPKIDFDAETGEILPIPTIPAIATPMNYNSFPHFGEINELPSLTVPDMSMSIQEILERHARGLGGDGIRVPIYEFDEDGNEIQHVPDLSQMDFADQYEYVRNFKANAEAMRKADSEAYEASQKKSEPLPFTPVEEVKEEPPTPPKA